jgi:hypothetical protein
VFQGMNYDVLPRNFFNATGGGAAFGNENINATGTANKTAFAFATDDRANAANGNVATSATAHTPGESTTLRIGNLAGLSATYGVTAYFRRVLYLPRRMSNAELASLTS